MTKKKTEPKIEKPKKLDVNVERSREQDRAALRRKVENFYDLQRLRIQTAGRTLKRADGTDIQLHEVDVAVLEARAAELHTAEKHALSDVQNHLSTMKFYKDTLSDKVRYRGIGPTMAGVILSSFDIHRSDTVSKMWAFAGLRPMPANRCKECHAVVAVAEDGASYRHTAERVRTPAPPKPGEEPKAALPKCKHAKDLIDDDAIYASGKSQRPEKGVKLPYNSFLRTKLVGVLAPVLLKVGSPWKKCYDEYKHRKASEGWGRSDAHRHQAAMRFMVKILLLDIWKEWRKSEGLEVRPSYQEEKLGHVHSASPKPAPRVQVPSNYEPLQADIAAELEYLEA